MSDAALTRTLTVLLDDKGRRLDQFLVSQLPDVSRVRVQQLIEQKKILINGKEPKPSMKLRGGEEIVITGAVELPPLRAFAEDIPLDVVYEDESIAVVNKAAGMSVHAGDPSAALGDCNSEGFARGIATSLRLYGRTGRPGLATAAPFRHRLHLLTGVKSVSCRAKGREISQLMIHMFHQRARG